MKSLQTEARQAIRKAKEGQLKICHTYYVLHKLQTPKNHLKQEAHGP